MEEVTIRKMVGGDEAFVISTWLRSYFYGSRFSEGIPHDVFFEWHQLVIKRILARGTASATIACLKEDPDIILGYLVTEPKVVHFAYVKEAFRKRGILRALVDASEIDPYSTLYYTHRMRSTRFLAQSYPALTYNPYLI